MLRRDLKVWELRQWIQLNTHGIDYNYSNWLRGVGMDTGYDDGIIGIEPGIIGIHVSEYQEHLEARAKSSGGRVQDVQCAHEWAFIDFYLGIGGDPKTMYVCIDGLTRRALGYPVVVTRKTGTLTAETLARHRHDGPETAPAATATPGITLSYDQLRAWADVLDLDADTLARLEAAIPTSTVPEAIATIVESLLSRAAL